MLISNVLLNKIGKLSTHKFLKHTTVDCSETGKFYTLVHTVEITF